MTFKDTPTQFQMIDLALIDPDPAHPRRNIDETALKGLANSIQKKGLIHPLVIQPANADGRYPLIVGERRRQAAVMAGEKKVPALIRSCEPDEALEVQVFENLGLGMRAALDPRDMANAIQTIAERCESRDAAAEHFGRSATWLNQATAAANLSPKVSALLDAGKISSTGAAIQLEKLAQKNEARADSLIDQVEQLPEGEKLAKKTVDNALSEEGGGRRKKDRASAPAPTLPVSAPNTAASAAAPGVAGSIPPWEELPASQAPAPSRRVNPGKVKRVAEILGLADEDEEAILARLIDEFLVLKGEGHSPF